MKKRKIIHIEHRAYDSYFPPRNSPYYYLAGWSSAVARQTMKRTDRYVIENWRSEREVKKPVVNEVQRIVCRLFPSRPLRQWRHWSPTMLKELRTQARRNEILVHHSGIHDNSLCLISTILRNTPIIAQHHGDSPPMVRFRQKRRIRTLLSAFAEKVFLKKVDHFFVLRKAEKEFLARFIPESHISVQTMGVDFAQFRPIEKGLARQKLNLAKNKKIILYVGKFYRLKGVDIILETYQQLKRKYDLEVVFVGGSSTDQLYNEVRLSGARFHGHLPYNKLPLYFSAADVYLLPSFSPSYVGGIGVAVIESLACGTPVVSTTLKDFPTEDWQKLGKIPQNQSDVLECVSEVFDNPSPYYNCRETAKRYYDWENIIHQTVKVYDRLFEKYYKK